MTIYLYYPAHVIEKAKNQKISLYKSRFNAILSTDDFAPQRNKTALNSLKISVQSDPSIIYFIAEFGDSLVFWPEKIKFFTHLRSVEEGTLLSFNERTAIAVRNVHNINSGKSEIRFLYGIDITDLGELKATAGKRVYLYILFVFIIFYLLYFLLLRLFYSPFKDVANRIHLFSKGQMNFGALPYKSEEFRQLDADLHGVLKRHQKLNEQLTEMPQRLDEALQKAAEVQHTLDGELKRMSDLVLLSFQLNEATDRKKLFKLMNDGLVNKMGFQISIIFVHEKNQLIYHSLKTKGLEKLDDNINKKLENYIIGSESDEYIELSNGHPILTPTPHFIKVLQEFHITGYFALVPVISKTHIIGMIAAGNLGGTKKIDDQDLEKLTLLSNLIALKIENIEAMKNLYRNVQMRTDELQTANKLLAESIIERDNMLKLVSHDMNAPLRNVVGLVDSIIRKYGDHLEHDVLNRIERIRNNIDKERQMIKDVLLNFRALEATGMEEEIDMFVMLSSIREELQHELEKKEIEFHIPDKLPPLKSKKHLIRHIFLNLVDNACKYLPSERSDNRIWIEAKETVDEITYSVSDNGKGIPQEKQLDIFLSYTSLDSIREIEFSGLGLGLALVKNIVEKLSGKIWIKSKMGAGTSFYVSLRKGKFEHITKNQV